MTHVRNYEMHKCKRLEIASRFYIIVEFYEVNVTGKCTFRIRRPVQPFSKLGCTSEGSEQ